MERVRLLTWNVWWQLGPWQQREELLQREIASAAPDVLALQEAWVAGSQSQAKRLGAATGLTHTAWSANRRPNRWRRRLGGAADRVEVGLAIASRWPILSSTEVALPLAGERDEGRTALAVVVDHPDGPLPVVTTHLASRPWDSAVRVAQVSAFANAGMAARTDAESLAGERDPWPLLLCGDLNALPESDEIRRLEGYLTTPLQRGWTFLDTWRYASPGAAGNTWVRDNPFVVGWSPTGRIDYVFASLDDLGRRGVVSEVSTVGDLGASAAVWPSDHLGVAVELRRP